MAGIIVTTFSYLLKAAFATALAGAVLTAPFNAGRAQEDSPGAEVVIAGRGFGHGVGLAQDGAYAMARAGASTRDILAAFYPGTGIGQRSGAVRVNLLDATVGDVVLGFPAGGEVGERGGEQSPGLPVTIRPGGSLRVSFDGEYRLSSFDGAETARPAAAAKVPEEPVAGAPLWVVSRDDASITLPERGKRYRGTIQVLASGGGLQLVNHLDVEDYLLGLGEVPGSWPAAALEAQAIAARTYALRFAAAGEPLCTSQQCQVYLGRGAESSPTSAAVAATAGEVVTYEGRLAETVYSASGGGFSATPEEGFGPGSPQHPYLRAAPYPTDDPQPWEQRLSLARLARVAGYPGEAADVSVTRTGPSGRPVEITFTGDAGRHAVGGHAIAQRLDLRSTFFTLRVERPAGPDAAAPAAGAAAGRRPAVVFEAATEGSGGPRRTPWATGAVLLIAAAGLGLVRSARSRERAAAPPPYTAPPGSTAASS